MTSGEVGGPARTCLLPGETDPAGVATLCVTPTVSSTITPTPTMVGTSMSLPTVGGGWGFILAIWIAGIAVCVYWIIERNRNRWK